MTEQLDSRHDFFASVKGVFAPEPLNTHRVWAMQEPEISILQAILAKRQHNSSQNPPYFSAAAMKLLEDRQNLQGH